ncbi:helix-turn-helix domain-containing protein [Streptomyces sp. NPDC058751]|uniref:helix-turn-helix domain-containing protein n=1 Tax=Streptomyces sp. NPDC058751 TaxID=3346623 RepID=UPI0036AF1D61
MDTENPSAPARPQSRIPGKNHPRRRPHSGVVHDNVRLTSHFTVVSNDLAQHPELSGVAIGLGLYIQSVPTGTPVDIKTLSARFSEGATRIAAALRELETHGYLRRTRERTSDGRIATRTIFCNNPGRHGTQAATTAPESPARRPAPADRPRRKALPAVPQPSCPSPALLRTAIDLLAGLRREDPRLLLSATDTEHLAPGVAAWLERDLTPTAVRHALTSALPDEPLHRPAALIAHRLTAQLPPPPPFRAPAPPPTVRHPLQNCDNCDLAFRGPEPGTCPSCTSKGRLPGISSSSLTDPPR